MLRGELKNDLYEVSVTLASVLVSLCFGDSKEEARRKVVDAIDSGRAYEKMKQWIAAQGGDVSYIDDLSKFPVSPFTYDVQSPADGSIESMDAEAIGRAAMILGAGRAEKDDVIDHSAGIVLKKKTGDAVRAGETIATLYTSKEESILDASPVFLNGLVFSTKKVEKSALVKKIIW